MFREGDFKKSIIYFSKISFHRFGGLDSEFAVVIGDVPLQERVSLIKRGNTTAFHVLWQSILKGTSQPLYATLGLRGACDDNKYAYIAQGPCDWLGRSLMPASSSAKLSSKFLPLVHTNMDLASV